MAFAQNALEAIALGSQVGAINNLNQAIGRSQRLHSQPWVMAGPGDGAQPGSAGAAVDSHHVSVQLLSAKSRLLMGDHGRASAELRPVAQAVPPGIAPTQLQLLRASGSLGLAEAAWRSGRVDDLGIELRIAASQLQSAAAGGADQADRVRALAHEISGRLATPSSLARVGSGDLAAWKSQVDGWLGGPSHGASMVSLHGVDRR